MIGYDTLCKNNLDLCIKTEPAMAGADETVYFRLLCQILVHKAFCAAIQIILGEIPKAPLMKFRHEIKFRPKRLKGLQLEFLLIDCGRGGRDWFQTGSTLGNLVSTQD